MKKGYRSKDYFIYLLGNAKDMMQEFSGVVTLHESKNSFLDKYMSYPWQSIFRVIIRSPCIYET